MVGKPLNRYEILELIDRGEKIPYPDDCSQVVHELIWADHVWRCRTTGVWCPSVESPPRTVKYS